MDDDLGCRAVDRTARVRLSGALAFVYCIMLWVFMGSDWLTWLAAAVAN